MYKKRNKNKKYNFLFTIFLEKKLKIFNWFWFVTSFLSNFQIQSYSLEMKIQKETD